MLTTFGTTNRNKIFLRPDMVVSFDRGTWTSIWTAYLTVLIAGTPQVITLILRNPNATNHSVNHDSMFSII